MSRKKKENNETGDSVIIGLLEKHATPPSSEDQLVRYSDMYLGRPVGYVEPVQQEPVSEIEEPVSDSAFEDEIQAAMTSDDLDNDYDEPGATVAMDAVEASPEMLADEMSEIGEVQDSYQEDVDSSEPDLEVGESEFPTVALDSQDFEALDVMVSEDNGSDIVESDETVMMGAVDDSDVEVQAVEPDGDVEAVEIAAQVSDDEAPAPASRESEGGRRKKKRRRR